jgi:hypothetical protein
VDPSVGSVGDAYDNALVESQIGLYKSELIWPHGQHDTLNWVHWFNTERPHESIDDLTPRQTERGPLRCTKPAPRSRMTHQNLSPETPGRLSLPVVRDDKAMEAGAASAARRRPDRRWCTPGPGVKEMPEDA